MLPVADTSASLMSPVLETMNSEVPPRKFPGASFPAGEVSLYFSINPVNFTSR